MARSHIAGVAHGRTTVPKCNIIQFKMLLVLDLVGDSMAALVETSCEHVHEHVAVPIARREQSWCFYYAPFSRVRRSRYHCTVCGAPLSTMGSGKVENDCFRRGSRNRGSAAHGTHDVPGEKRILGLPVN